MPPDTATPAHRRRRQQLEDDAATERRRSRGEISCAECRRLKLKCDKQLPCSSCVRRGCAPICPNGTLSTGQGTRFVLADTEQLHRKIAEMAQRIRQLEDALAIFQAGVSNETHPLLQEELLSVKYGLETHTDPNSQDDLDGSVDALGTLTIDSRGDAKYFGPSAGSEPLFLAGAESSDFDGHDDDHLVPPELSHLSISFPFGSNAPEIDIHTLYSFLPKQPRAWTLCETYYEHVTPVFDPIKRDELIDDILTPVYKLVKATESGHPSPPAPVSPHQLALLYIVFALGAQKDLTLPPQHPEANLYYHLCRAALSLRSMFDSPEVSTVQAIVLMSMYIYFGGSTYTLDSSWSLGSLGFRLGQSIGIHRDSARWGLDAKTVNRRRWLFWQCFMQDLFMSVALGRPPSIQLSYVDCEFPEDDEQVIDDAGQTQVGYNRWKFEFGRDIMAEVIDRTLKAQTPSYQTILELDRKVREKRLPPHLDAPFSEDEAVSPSQYMRRHMFLQMRMIVLTYIHRSFFARALLDHPANPLCSPYAPSFLSAYRCALVVINNCNRFVNRMPDLCFRSGLLWTHLFAAALIVGSIVTRAPASTVAHSAFVEFGLVVNLFEKGAAHSARARRGLVILNKLRTKAYQVYAQFRSGQMPSKLELSLSHPGDDGDDDLAIFGGQTRVLATALLSKRAPSVDATGHSPTSHQTSREDSPTDHSQRSSPGSSDVFPEMHPSLAEYFSSFPQPTPPQSTVSPMPGGTNNNSNTPSSLLSSIPSPTSSAYQMYNELYLQHAQAAMQEQQQHLQQESMLGLGLDPSLYEQQSVVDYAPMAESPPPPFVPAGIDEQWAALTSGLLSFNNSNPYS